MKVVPRRALRPLGRGGLRFFTPSVCLRQPTFGVFIDKLCHREKNVPQMKLLGVALAVVGALMVFTV